MSVLIECQFYAFETVKCERDVCVQQEPQTGSRARRDPVGFGREACYGTYSLFR
jgi:hypothetical protein